MEPSRLKQLRLARHWTLVEAAQALEVSVNTLNRWEMSKQMPHGYNLQQICKVFRVSPEDLGFGGNGNLVAPDRSSAPQMATFIAGDLSMRLLTLAFTPGHNFTEVQEKVGLILEEFDAMNIDPMTRREALRRLAALAIMPLYPSSSHATLRPMEDILIQQAASIAACQELGRGRDVTDLELAFEGASSTLQKLIPIVKDSSRHRKAAATLAAQAAQLQTVFGRHLKGAEAAIHYGQQAVLYSKESGDAPERLMALVALAWAYYYMPQYSRQALQIMEQAVALLKDPQTHVPLYIHGQVYSALAVMQARNGLTGDVALRQATKHAFADQGYAMFVDDPVVTLIINEAESLYHQGEHSKALASLAQLIDSSTLRAKRAMSERERIGVLSNMTLASLKIANKDLEYCIYLWQTTIQGARVLKSEQRFNETVFAYHIMDALWSNDRRIKDLRPLTVHW